MKMHRERYSQGRQTFVRYRRVPSFFFWLRERCGDAGVKIIHAPPVTQELKWPIRDIHGKLLYPPAGIKTFTRNNWMRTLFRAFNVRRAWVRAV